MFIRFSEVEKIVSDAINFSDGEPLYWFKGVWSLIEKNNLDQINTTADEIRIYSMIFGMCVVYHEFACVLSDSFNDSDYIELVLDIKKLIPEDFGENFFCYNGDEDLEFGDSHTAHYLEWVIHNLDNKYMIFELLKKELGINKTYASLYYSIKKDEFTLEDWETDDFYYGEGRDENDYDEDYECRKRFSACENMNELYNEILNYLDDNKCRAFEWLTEMMR